MTAQDCRDLRRNGTCIQRLAAGWIGLHDLCGPCTRRFMAALETLASPGELLEWHPNFRDRAEGGGS